MIKYCEIGVNLQQSLLPQINNEFFDAYSLSGFYEINEISQSEMESGNLRNILLKYKGINVNNPYKQSIMKYLDEVSEEAIEIGAVNTINNVDGKLIGYNTESYAFGDLLKQNNISPKRKTFVILGSGNAAKSAVYYLKDLAKDVFVVSRDVGETINGAIMMSYEDLSNVSGDVLVNATPVGSDLYENESIVDNSIISKFSILIDLVYNPTYTKFLQIGVSLGKICVSGLGMQVSQAIKSESYWQGISMDAISKRVYATINIKQKKKENANIYITGMMGCGKTELGKCLSQKMDREFIDLDSYIEKMAGRSVEELFSAGEDSFREIESQAIKKVSLMKNKIVALGGGCVLREFNLLTLRLSGIVVFRDRPLEKILATMDLKKRAFFKDKEQVIRLFNDRYPKYLHLSDCTVPYGELKEDSDKIVGMMK